VIMSRVTLAFACVVAIIGIAASVAIRQSGQARLREKVEASRQQAEQIAQLTADNKRLSNLVARVDAPPTLPPEQLSELLRLRGQMGEMRKAAKEQARLEATNQQLRAKLATLEQQVAAARAAPNFSPKEELAFAGYTDPEATLKSALWAINKGDLRALLACTVAGPEIAAQLERQPKAELEQRMAAEGKKASESLAPCVGFHILNKETTSPDEVTVNLSFDGEGKTRKFTLKKVGDEWRLAQMFELVEHGR